MANTTPSPNMGMPIPTVGEDPGPDWATNVNASLSVVDSHNHTSGQGVPITPDGININTDLPLNDNNLITARTLRFTPQSATPGEGSDIGCLYENGVDLYYIDGAGNDIRITQSGSVTGSSGTITGLPSGTASASFAAGTFTFQSATNTPASMDVGSVKISQDVSSGFGVTVSAAVSQSSDYSVSLPVALPAGTRFLTLDNTGQIGDSYNVDNATLEVDSNLIQVKDLGIGNDQLAGNIPNSKLAPVVSGATAGPTYINSSGTLTTFASVTLTTTGARPVIITLIPNSDSASGRISLSSNTVANCVLLRNSVVQFMTELSTGADSNLFPPSIISFLDNPSAGSTTYTLQFSVSGNSVDIRRTTLIAYEL